jgi:phosphoribosylformylglycinamidine synthase
MTNASGGALKVAVLRFPGSNCDTDCARVFQREFDADVHYVWHTATEIPPVDLVVIPGGFSFGDYLRSGALAAHAPVTQALRSHVARGAGVLGICNGFQILAESKILPGALLANTSGKFICKDVILTNNENMEYRMPVAHGEGRYFIDTVGLRNLIDNDQIAFRYKGENPNGSTDGIAGIYSANKKVLGMMPHPERAATRDNGLGTDGLTVLRAFVATL